MSTFYEEMAIATQEIVHDFQTGIVQLKRRTSTLQDPDVAYLPSAATYDVYDLEAVVLGVEAEYVDGELIKFDDLEVITSPFFKLNGTQILLEPQMGDELSIGDEIHRIVKIERVPATGTASAFFIFVKS
jgi:hypothetical protein